MKSLHNDMIFMHALFNLPIQNLMKNTCYNGGDLAFPLACHIPANNLYQNYKRTLLKNSKTTQQRISLLLENIDLLTTFEDNYCLQELLQNNTKAKKMVRSGGQARGSPYRNSTPNKMTKQHSDAEEDLNNDYQDDSVDGSFYNTDPALPTPVVHMALS